MIENENTGKLITYKGQIVDVDFHGDDDLLSISSMDLPLAEELKSQISGKFVSARYWITDKEATRDEADESFIRHIFGGADCTFNPRYGDYTGYLWTDEECNIGGHNLIEELYSYIGKWIILEIFIFNEDNSKEG